MTTGRPGNGLARGGVQGRYTGLLPTLGAGSTVQVLAAVAGFATLPITVHAVGERAFGVLVVVVSLAPWLTLVDGALYPAVRLLVGEARTPGAGAVPRPLLQAAFRLSLRILAANITTLGLGLLVLPLVALFASQGVATRGELVLAVTAFAVPVLLSGPGGIYLGALEGSGRTVVAALLSGAGPLVALPATVLVVLLDGGLVAFCAVQGLAVAVPRLCAWAYWHLRPSWQEADEDRPVPVLRPRLVAQMVFLSTAVLCQTGLDPVIVSSSVGADGAAAFGLASRLVTGALIPLAVVTPLFAGNIAASRAAGWSARSDRDLRHLVGQAAAAGLVVGTCVAVLGPRLAELLGAGQVDAPLALYLAGAAYVLTTFTSIPLYLAFSGPTGLARSVGLNGGLTALNVAVSLVLVRTVGVSGPMWASAGTGLLAVLFWLAAWVRHPEWLAERHALDGDVLSPAQRSGQPG